MKKFKMSLELSEANLYSLFGRSSKYIKTGGFYFIHFNNKDISADTPSDLFKKVKDEYKMYCDLNNYYNNGI